MEVLSANLPLHFTNTDIFFKGLVPFWSTRVHPGLKLGVHPDFTADH
jgi:hypothetical protein